MSQRGISNALVELVLRFGSDYPSGKVRLDRRTLRSVMTEIESLKKDLIRAEQKGGVVVVIGDEGTFITTYPLGH